MLSNWPGAGARATGARASIDSKGPYSTQLSIGDDKSHLANEEHFLWCMRDAKSSKGICFNEEPLPQKEQ